ncbi:LysR family transcriptional regulator [Bacteriovoracaceae bacterium]|nr:LysR family transcriptional regulator [Bacteriovoracaceae bacterium]
MNFDRMTLSKDESELLMAFEQAESIEKVANVLKKDPSGVSRQIKKITEVCDALEKKNGKWRITELGKKLNSITRNYIAQQNLTIHGKRLLRIGTNREFASRILATSFSRLQNSFPNFQFSLTTHENGTEESLINGEIDVSFDCGKPYDPIIGFKQIKSDEIVAVCAPDFYKKYHVEIEKNKLNQIPHLLCVRLYPHLRSNQEEFHSNVIASFNDIATTREVCLHSVGWALLPQYSVQKELKEEKLIKIKSHQWETTKYGVWWSRERFKDQSTILELQSFLEKLDF